LFILSDDQAAYQINVTPQQSAIRNKLHVVFRHTLGTQSIGRKNGLAVLERLKQI